MVFPLALLLHIIQLVTGQLSREEDCSLRKTAEKYCCEAAVRLLAPDQDNAIQRTEPPAVSQPGGSAEPDRTTKSRGTLSSISRQTQFTDKEERYIWWLQGNQSGAGTGHQWEGAWNLPQEVRRKVCTEGKSRAETAGEHVCYTETQVTFSRKFVVSWHK